MLIQLASDQVTSMWDAFKFGIIHSTEVVLDRALTYTNSKLMDILGSRCQAWAMFDKSGLEKILYGVATTYIREDMASGKKYLSIDSFYIFQEPTIEMLKQWFDTFEAFAKESKCSEIMIDTKIEKLQRLLDMYEFNVTQTKEFSRTVKC